MAESNGIRTPQSLEDEQSTLGAMLLEREAAATALAMLAADDFYRQCHRFIFRTIADLHGRGEPIDVVTVSEELRRAGNLAASGGIPYIGVLVEVCPSSAEVERYARRVREFAMLRRMMK